jgi:hypothetical protein
MATGKNIQLLMGLWIASLALVVAAPSTADDSSPKTQLQLSAGEDCNRWNAPHCMVADPQREAPRHRRVKPKDVLRFMADAMSDDGFHLMNIGPVGRDLLAFSRKLDIITYSVTTDYQGARLRLRSKQDEWAMSLRESSGSDDNDLTLKLGIELRW